MLLFSLLFGISMAVIFRRKQIDKALPKGLAIILISSFLSYFSLIAATSVFGKPFPQTTGMDYSGAYVGLAFIFIYPIITAVTYLIAVLIMRNINNKGE